MPDPRIRQAFDLISVGRPDDARPLLAEIISAPAGDRHGESVAIAHFLLGFVASRGYWSARCSPGADRPYPPEVHQQLIRALLERHGVTSELARFARTHGAWSRETLPLEDLLVALADTVWKGQRVENLESQVVAEIAEKTGGEQWEVFDKLDGLLDEIAARGDERLAWQQRVATAY